MGSFFYLESGIEIYLESGIEIYLNTLSIY